MAFGAESLTWACYTAGWWDNQVVDKQGNKTQQYDKLKKVNSEIHRFGPRYMLYTRRSTSFVGFEGKAIVSDVAEVGMDVDKPADWELAQKYLGTN
jgi:hypothetical protein